MKEMFDRAYVLTFAQKLLAIDSPSGYTHHAIAFLKKEAQTLGYKTALNEKGNLLIYVSGASSEKTIGLSAHTDTLGLMVRSIKESGTLALTTLGGPILPTLDGEYCRIITRSNKVYSGTILSTSPATHVYPDAASVPRDLEHLEVRIDEMVKNKEAVKKLGIANGDIVAIDPKTTVTESGFIKSRFLDDKISVSVLFGVLQYLRKHDVKPNYDCIIMISTYEEVGHGASCMPKEVSELLAVDMGCIGLDLDCTEYDVSICAKDSSGPYDYAMTSHLVKLAQKHDLHYALDIYPFYGSDVSAALRCGNDLRGALIGPGVHASHGMERTHYEALEQTMQLVLAYLCEA